MLTLNINFVDGADIALHVGAPWPAQKAAAVSRAQSRVRGINRRIHTNQCMRHPRVPKKALKAKLARDKRRKAASKKLKEFT